VAFSIQDGRGMTKRLAVVAALLAFPLGGSGQVTTGGTITINESFDSDVIINVAECTGAVTDLLSFSWTTGGSVDLLASDTANCPTPSTDSTTVAKTITIRAGVTTGSLTSVISAPDLLNQLSISCPGSRTTVFLCLFNSGTTVIAATGQLQLDLQTPPPPVAGTPGVGDSALNVNWSLGAGSADAGTSGAPTGFNVYCEVAGATPPPPAVIEKRCAALTGGGTTTARIGGLTNETAYDVEVTAVSRGGNESGRSNRVTGTPVQIDDFWRLYRAVPGREQGGCSSGAAGALALLLLVPIALHRRRGRR
jgi:Synergist-CTERM protein sorting domain-containing protein